MLKSSEESGALRFADLEIDLYRQTVSRHGRVLPIQGRSFQLLTVLVERHPELVTQADLIATVWGRTVVGSDALTQRVKLLRRALAGESSHDYIVSVHGQGYRLVEPRPLLITAPRSSSWSPRSIAYITAIALLATAVGLILSTPHALKHAIRHLLP